MNGIRANCLDLSLKSTESLDTIGREEARRRALLLVQSWQMSFKHTTVRHQSTRFATLCRLNYRSHGIENSSDLW